jgi:hypothetical protein
VVGWVGGLVMGCARIDSEIDLGFFLVDMNDCRCDVINFRVRQTDSIS